MGRVGILHFYHDQTEKKNEMYQIRVHINSLRLDWNGNMSFLTGQDRTTKFAAQVLQDWTETRLIFSNQFFFFLKVLRTGRKTSSVWKVQFLKICQNSGPDVKSGRALKELLRSYCSNTYYVCHVY